MDGKLGFYENWFSIHTPHPSDANVPATVIHITASMLALAKDVCSWQSTKTSLLLNIISLPALGRPWSILSILASVYLLFLVLGHAYSGDMKPATADIHAAYNWISHLHTLHVPSLPLSLSDPLSLDWNAFPYFFSFLVAPSMPWSRTPTRLLPDFNSNKFILPP